MPTKKIDRLKRLRKNLHLKPQEMAESLSMSAESYGNLEYGRRQLYVSDLLRLHQRHGVAPNDILLPERVREHYKKVAELRPPTATVRALIVRYLRLPADMRKTVDRLIDAMYRMCLARGEINDT